MRAARLEAGISERELARRSGVSQASISGIEAGRDPGLATFSRLAAALPGLDVPAALGSRVRVARPASPRLWAFLAKGLGLSSRRVRLHADVDARGRIRPSLLVEDLRLRGGLRDPARRVAAMGAVLAGSPDVAWRLHEIEQGGGDPLAPRVVVDGDVVHRFELSRGGVTYRREHRGGPLTPGDAGLASWSPGPRAEGISCWLDHPTRALELSATFPAGARPLVRIESWPASLAVDAEHSGERWSALHPGAPGRLSPDEAGRVVAIITKPAPTLRWGLSWSEGSEALAPSALRVPASGRPRSVARSLARVRRSAGLSSRELARRIGVSPATIIAVEAGREPRVSTVAAWLGAGSGATPWSVVTEPVAPMQHAEAWSTQRDLFGFEAEEELREFVLTPEGGQRARLTTRGLSWVPEAEAHLKLRLGALRMPESGRRRLLAVLSKPSAGARIRGLPRGPGSALHELSFSPKGSSPRVTYVREAVIDPGQYAMTAERARAPEFAGVQWRARRKSGAVAESIHIEPALPSKLLRLRIAFPRGFEPVEPIAKVLPRAVFAVESLPDLRPRVHPDGFELRVRGRELDLRVTQPLVGLRYSVSWELR